MPVVNNQGHIIIFIMAESLCQELAEKTEKTRANTSIGSFKVESQILVDSQVLKYKWLLVSVIVLKHTTGEPARLIGVSVDITSCVQAEISFRESERQFCPIFNSFFQFIGLLIIKDMVLEVKQTALHLGELQPQDVVECPYWEIWWTLLVNQEHLQYLLSSSPAVIYTCKIYAVGSTFIRENIVARSYQVREMLKKPNFWASKLHSLLDFFLAPLILGIRLEIKFLKMGYIPI